MPFSSVDDHHTYNAYKDNTDYENDTYHAKP